MIWRDIFSCIAMNGLSAAAGFRLPRICSANVAIDAINGLALDNASYCSRKGWSCCIKSAAEGIDESPNKRLHKRAVEREIGLGYWSPRSQSSRSSARRFRRARECRRASRISQRITQSPTARSGLPSHRSFASKTASYRPGGNVSIRSILLENSSCCLRATPPETKIPRWPTLS